MKTDNFFTRLLELETFRTVCCGEAMMGLNCTEREGPGSQTVDMVNRVSGRNIDV